MTRYYSFAPHEFIFLVEDNKTYKSVSSNQPAGVIDLTNKFVDQFLLASTTEYKGSLRKRLMEHLSELELPERARIRQLEVITTAWDFLKDMGFDGKDVNVDNLFTPLNTKDSSDEGQLYADVVLFTADQSFRAANRNPFGIVRRKFGHNIVDNIKNNPKWQENDLVTFGLSLMFQRFIEINRSGNGIEGIEPDLNVFPITVSPNWLFAGTPDTNPDQGTGGGPGTLPVPASIEGYSSVSVSHPNAPWSFNPDPSGEESIEAVQGYANAVLGKMPNRNGERPVVIVLDTAPPANAEIRGRRQGIRTLDAAYAEWSGNHPLLASLLKPGIANIEDEDKDADGLPRIRRVGYENMSIWYADEYSYQGKAPDPYDPNDYDQKRICKSIPDEKGHRFCHRAMDHGTFVAGIIHTLCPSADIHLVQVLNDYAHGNLMVLARQLFRILDYLKPNAPIIVNMSLTFDIPLEQAHQLTPNWGPSPPDDAPMQQKRRKEIEDILIDDKELRENLISILRYLTESIVVAVGQDERNKPIFKGNGRIVAAAGNDRKHSNYVPKARYPAAFGNVIGVASLRHDGDDAKYSNTADLPRWWGFSAVGGNQDDNHPGWSDSEHGLLGLYIGEFPKTRDDNGNPVAIEETNNHENPRPNRNGWARWSGTSFATPVVVGRLACLLSGSETADLGWAVRELQRRVDEPGPTLPDRVNMIQGSADSSSRT